MMIALHKNARTKPAIRAEMGTSSASVANLAKQYGVSESTVRKWKSRESVVDASHPPHRLKTTLTPAQEAVVVQRRKTLVLSLDDLLAVTRELICDKATRSGLDRFLLRHGVGNFNAPKSKEPAEPHKAIKRYVQSIVRIDVKYLPQMPDESNRRYLFVAIVRATRRVFVQIENHKTAAAARSFLKALDKACAINTQKFLPDNGKEFTGRICASRGRRATGKHEFDEL